MIYHRLNGRNAPLLPERASQIGRYMRSYQDFAHPGIESQSAVYLALGVETARAKGMHQNDTPQYAHYCRNRLSDQLSSAKDASSEGTREATRRCPTEEYFRERYYRRDIGTRAIQNHRPVSSSDSLAQWRAEYYESAGVARQTNRAKATIVSDSLALRRAT